jgi:hypothetical protein
MASPAVAATTEGALATAGANVAVTLPGSGGASDGYLVIIAKGSVSVTVNTLTDWAEALDEATGTGLAVLWYTGTGVPSDPTFVQSGNSRSAWAAYRITGTDRATTPTVGTTATGSSINPNPPSATVTGGPKDILAIAVFSRGGEIADDDSLVSAFPTNYTSGQVEKSAGTVGSNLAGIIGSAARQVSAASSEDPGTFTAVTGAWRAQTIIVYPAVPISVSGGVASESDTAPAGKVLQVYTASPAAESDTALVGQVAQRYTASPAAEADTAPAGTVIQPQIVSGGVASEADSAPAGQAQQIYPAGTASESDTALAGQVAERYTASPAGEADSAPAGHVLQVYTTTPASEGDSAPGGSVLQVYTASPATEADAALPGSVSQGGSGTTVNGGVASEADSAPGGLVAQVYTAAPATEADVAIVGQVLQAIIVQGGVAGEGNSAPAGTASTATDWSYNPAANWTYAGMAGFTYTGGTAATYGGDPDWTYHGGD